LRNGIRSAPDFPNSLVASAVFSMPSGICSKTAATLESAVSAVSAAVTPICFSRLASSLLPVCASMIALENFTRPPVSCSKPTPDCSAAYFSADSASTDMPTFCEAS
jgi:hypothetical protein